MGTLASIAILFAITALTTYACADAGLRVDPRPERPGLLINADELARVREQMRKEPWAQAAWTRLKQDADKQLPRDVRVPEKPAGHFQQYYCPKCGFMLDFDANKPSEHPCASCGKVYSGEPYDGGWRAVVQHQLGEAAVRLALAYQLSLDQRYARKSAEILKAYAGVYASYPVQRAGGRAFFQSLTECQWTINLAWAYDLIAESGALTPEDRAHIESDLLKASADQIMTRKVGGNWQTWHNAAMAVVGWCIGDETLVKTAIEDPSRGALRQIETNLYPDGFQVEGSFGYHYYTLRALRWTLEAAWHKGTDLYQHPHVKRAFLGPPKMVMPNGEFPSVNDGANPPLCHRAPLYEVARARIDDPSLGRLLRAVYESVGRHDRNSEPVHGGATFFEQEVTGRDNIESLLFGRPLPDDGEFDESSAILPDIGFVALRAGGNYVFMDYGPHAGGHGHPDKLNVAFYALGRNVAPDVGAVGYSMPSYVTWNRHTASHNTVTINGQSQQQAKGPIHDCVFSPTVQMADASCDTAYPGAYLRRIIWLTGEYMVDFFRVRTDSTEPVQVDWFWHSFADPTTALALTPRAEPPGTGSGYQHFTNLKSAKVDDQWSADWVLEGDYGRVRMTMLGEPGTEVILADGIGTIPAQRLPTAIVRRHGRETLYRAVMEPFAKQSRVSRIEDLSSPSASGVRILLADGSSRIHVLADGLAEFDELVLDRGAVSASFDSSGKPEWLQFSGGRRLIAGNVRVRLASEGSIWIAGNRLGVTRGDGMLNLRLPDSHEIELDMEPDTEHRL